MKGAFLRYRVMAYVTGVVLPVDGGVTIASPSR